MSKLVWDKTGERFFETGVDHGVLYRQVAGAYPKGVVWNGLTAVNENPSGAEASPQYADNIKYLNLISAEDYGATIEAFYYPDEFAECDGSAEPIPGLMIGQQTRKPFGLSYRTKIGNDTEGQDLGYKLHFIYNALAAPSAKDHGTVNESPEPTTFSWELTTTPVEMPKPYKPTAAITIDSTKIADKTKLEALEAVIYGSESVEARLPLPEEVLTILGVDPDEAAG